MSKPMCEILQTSGRRVKMNKIRTNLIAFTEDDSFPLKKEYNKKWQFTK